MAVPSETFCCPLTDSHTEQMSNHRFQERHAISRLSAALCPHAAYWEVHVLYPDNPTHSPCQIIDDSIGWCETCLHCHHVLIPGRLGHPTGTQILLTVCHPGAPLKWNAGAEELWLLLALVFSFLWLLFIFKNLNHWIDINYVTFECNCYILL